MGEFPPVVLFVYNRPDHLRRTLESLNRNRLASQAKLYVFSDGPRDEMEKERIESVRKLIRQPNIFRDTQIIESEVNKGLASSVIAGVSEVINEHGHAIVLEDDILTSPGWYDFMSRGLAFYKERADVWSIGGYCPPIAFPSGYSLDVFLSPLATSYSWATWNDRWQLVDWLVSDYDDFLADSERVKRFSGWNPSRLRLLRRTMKSNRSSWAIRWEYAAAKHSCLNILPTKSRVQSIGYDSGEHSRRSGAAMAAQKYAVTIVDDSASFAESLRIESGIMAELTSFYRTTVYQRCVCYLHRLFDRIRFRAFR